MNKILPQITLISLLCFFVLALQKDVVTSEEPVLVSTTIQLGPVATGTGIGAAPHRPNLLVGKRYVSWISGYDNIIRFDKNSNSYVTLNYPDYANAGSNIPTLYGGMNDELFFYVDGEISSQKSGKWEPLETRGNYICAAATDQYGTLYTLSDDLSIEQRFFEKYDGNGWTLLTTKDVLHNTCNYQSSSVGFNRAVLDNNGWLWTVGDTHTSYFNGRGWTNIWHNNLSIHADNIAVDSIGNRWFVFRDWDTGDSNLIKVSGSASLELSFVEIPSLFNDSTFPHITVDQDDNIWLRASSGTTGRYNGEEWDISWLPDSDIYFDNMTGSGIQYDKWEDVVWKGGHLAYFSTQWNYAPAATGIWDVDISKSGHLWFSNASELIHVAPDNEWTTYTNKNGLPNPFTYHVAVDQNESVWVSYRPNPNMRLSSSLLSHFDGTSWSHFGSADGVKSHLIEEIEVDNDNSLWVVYRTTYFDSYGIDRFDGESWTNFNLEQGIDPDRAIHEIYGNDFGVWVRYRDTGLSYLQGEQFVDVPELNGQQLAFLLTTPDGTFWVGVVGGVYTFDGTAWTYVELPGFIPLDAVVSPKGEVLVIGPSPIVYKIQGNELISLTSEELFDLASVNQAISTDDGKIVYFYGSSWAKQIHFEVTDQIFLPIVTK